MRLAYAVLDVWRELHNCAYAAWGSLYCGVHDGAEENAEERVRGVRQRRLARDPPLPTCELAHPVRVEVPSVAATAAALDAARRDDDAGAVVRRDVDVAVAQLEVVARADGHGVVLDVISLVEERGEDVCGRVRAAL